MADKLTRTEDAAELRPQAEEMARADAASPVVAMSPEDMRRALHELRVHQIELEMQNEELRRTQGELKASQAQYSELYDQAPVGYLTIDEQGLVLKANLAAAMLLGVTGSALVKRPFMWFILKEDQDLYYLYRKQLPETGSQHFCELRMLKSDRTQFWAHLEATAAPDAEGVLVCYVTLNDITERNLTEEKLRASENRLRETNVLQGLLLPPNSLEQKLKLVTESVVHVTGADFARIWVMNPGDRCATGCVHAQVTEGPHVCRFREQCLHLLASSGRYTHTNGDHGRVPFGCYKIGKIASGEEPKFLTQAVTADPRVHNHAWAKELGLVSFAGYRLVDAEGTPLGVLALFSKQAILPEEESFLEGIADVTSHLLHSARFEAALRESEERFRCLFDSSKDAFMTLMPPDWRFTSSNPSAVATFRARDEAEFTSKAPWELSPERQSDGRLSAEKATAMIEQALREGYHYFEWTHKRLDGEEFSATVLLTRLELQGRISLNACVRDITEHKQAEAALRESESRYRTLVESIPQKIFLKGRDFRWLSANENFARDLGLRPEELVGKGDYDFFPKHLADLDRADDQRIMQTGQTEELEEKYLLAGRERWVHTVKAPVRDERGEVSGVFGIFWDITEHKQAEADKARLETRLLQAQKLESVGRLAGGVAHTFNNKLMGIMNYVEMCRDELPPEHSVRSYLDEITSEAKHSADIARQLLAFARKQHIAPKVLDLNGVLAGMLGLQRQLLGEDIDLDWRPGEALWPAKLDPAQIDQVLTNLCANARDAIAGVGRVAIETANVTLDQAYCAEHTDATPGECIRLTISDTGCGMDAQVVANLFEPFFTTHELAEGAGLGLATVYGIVRQNHGHIEVQSEVGKGTAFRIYLPRATREAGTGSVAGTPERLPHGTETILLAEDEKSVRVTSRLFLEALGYTVLAAETPEEALRLGGTHAGPIHLLVSDVIMPGMNGPDLASFLTGEHPKLRCLFMSGYTADVLKARGTLDEGMPFLSKPFSRHDLACKVREVLDGD